DPQFVLEAFRGGADGVMVGRVIFGNPGLFSGWRRKPENSPELVEGLPSAQERLRILVEHATLFRELYMNPSTGSGSHHIKSFDVMRKHFKAYVNGFPGAAELRAELMKTMDSRGVSVTIDKYIGNGV
ncbi:MAG: tRNA-dihydrouridine synthase, partial [Patescibacteria group bacterium]